MDNLKQALLESENSLMLLSDEELITPINDVLLINPETRLIEIPDTELLLGVFGENLVEKKHFKCPRIVLNNIDLYECFIFVNYVSANGKTGYIQCEDVELDETGQYILFSWDLTNNVFDKNKDSTIYFSVSAKQYLEDSEPAFFTRKAQGKMYETVNGTEIIQEEYADIILQILAGMKTKFVIKGTWSNDVFTSQNEELFKLSIDSSYTEISSAIASGIIPTLQCNAGTILLSMNLYDRDVDDLRMTFRGLFRFGSVDQYAEAIIYNSDDEESYYKGYDDSIGFYVVEKTDLTRIASLVGGIE